MSTPRRFKAPEELTTAELLAAQQAEARGEPAPRFERMAYQQARADALRAGGMDAEADEIEAGLDDGDGERPGNEALEAMSPDQLHDHLTKER